MAGPLGFPHTIMASELLLSKSFHSDNGTLFIRGPALPSVVRNTLTTDGRAGPRMKSRIGVFCGAEIATCPWLVFFDFTACPS